MIKDVDRKDPETIKIVQLPISLLKDKNSIFDFNLANLPSTLGAPKMLGDEEQLDWNRLVRVML
jgi:hypothetical protein